MADTKIKDLTEKATGEATDEFVINDVAGGNADKKMDMAGLRIAGTQISSGTIDDDRLSSNVPLLDVINTFTRNQQVTRDGAQVQIELIQATAGTTGSLVDFHSSRGSIATPSATQSGDSLGVLQFQGYGTNQFGPGARINAVATEAHTDSARGTKYRFFTADNGTTTLDERFSIDQDGSFDFFSGTINNFVFDANGTGNSLSNVDVADLANGTDGELITWNSSGVAATVGAGTSAQVLTSNGAGAAPTFQAAAGGGLTFAKIVKTADDTVKNSNTTFDDDAELVFAASANTIYSLIATLWITSGTVGDFKYRFTLPTSASGDMNDTFWSPLGGNGATQSVVSNQVAGTNGQACLQFTCRFEIDSTAGDVQLQWAQNTSDATDTNVLLGSTFLVWEEGTT